MSKYTRESIISASSSIIAAANSRSNVVFYDTRSSWERTDGNSNIFVHPRTFFIFVSLINRQSHLMGRGMILLIRFIRRDGVEITRNVPIDTLYLKYKV